MADERVRLLWQQVIAGINVSYGDCILAGQCGVLQVSGDSEDQRISQEYFMSHRTAHVRLTFFVQKGGMVFWKTFTVVVLLDWFLQMEEIDRGLSFPMY